MVHRMDNIVAQGTFSWQEQNTSSTHRELLAICYMIESFGNILKNETIQWYSDNSNVDKIINSGSIKPDLQEYCSPYL